MSCQQQRKAFAVTFTPKRPTQNVFQVDFVGKQGERPETCRRNALSATAAPHKGGGKKPASVNEQEKNVHLYFVLQIAQLVSLPFE